MFLLLAFEALIPPFRTEDLEIKKQRREGYTNLIPSLRNLSEPLYHICSLTLSLPLLFIIVLVLVYHQKDVSFEAVMASPILCCHVDDNLSSWHGAEVVEIDGFMPTL